MLGCYGCGLVEQISERTAIGAAARRAAHRAAHDAERIEAILRNCGCVGAFPAAAVPVAQDSFASGARALSSRAGAASLCRAARTCGVGGEYPSLAEHLHAQQGWRVGLGACAAERGAFCRRQSALLHARERSAGVARGGAAAGASKPAPLTAGGCAIIRGCSDANVAELVDAPGLEPGGETRASSSLAFRTTLQSEK